MQRESDASTECTYQAKLLRLHIHLDWYLYSSLSVDEEERNFTLDEVQRRLRTDTGIKIRKSTILRRNTQYFEEHQCSPLHRVDQELYALDPVYFSLAGDKVRPPQAGPGRPRKKYTQGDQELDEQP